MQIPISEYRVQIWQNSVQSNISGNLHSAANDTVCKNRKRIPVEFTADEAYSCSCLT